MQPINFECPPSAFPASFEGRMALAVWNANSDAGTLWLLFDVSKGSTVAVSAAVCHGREMPQEIADAKPIVVAQAPRDVWVLLVENEEFFYKRVAEAKVHISGDYRVFGRYALSLLRAIKATNLWGKIDSLLSELRNGRQS